VTIFIQRTAGGEVFPDAQVHGQVNIYRDEVHPSQDVYPVMLQVQPEDADVSLCRPHGPQEHEKQRGLPRAVGPQYSERLPPRHGYSDIIYGASVSKALSNAFYAKDNLMLHGKSVRTSDGFSVDDQEPL